MKLISRLRDRCYCAFCKAERKVYVKKHIDLTNVLGALLLSSLATHAVWGSLDPRGLLLLGILLAGGETLVYLRWRWALPCQYCGFDPVIYKRSPEQASARVRAFYLERAENPEFWLSRSPLLELQRQKREKERKEMEYKALKAKLAARLEASVRPAAQAIPKAPPKSVAKTLTPSKGV